MGQWKNMDTAPRDGTHITVVNAHNASIPPATVHWFDGGWHLSVNQKGEYSEYVWGPPTHWMPTLWPPSAPPVAERGGGGAQTLRLPEIAVEAIKRKLNISSDYDFRQWSQIEQAIRSIVRVLPTPETGDGSETIGGGE